MQFQGRIENHWLGTPLSWIVPALVFVAIWGLFMRRMGTASGPADHRQEQGEGLRGAGHGRDLRRCGGY